MGIIPSRNLEEQRREQNGVTYFDRGVIEGRDGRKYSRYAIQTHFVKVGEDQAALVERYVRPLYQPGDMLSFGAKVMCMCVRSVKTRDEVKPGWWANHLWRFAGINHTGVGMHEPYKLQLVIDMCGLPRVLLAAAASAVTKLFGMHGVFYKVCGKGVGGIDGFYTRSSFELYHQMALINRKLNPRLETMFLPSSAKYTYVSSSMVKEMARYGADLSDFVPREIIADIREKMNGRRDG